MEITAIFKNKCNKQSTGNYRPVSLTNVVCKIMESIIRESNLCYFTGNSLLTNKQFGFLCWFTVLQLLIIVDKWTEMLDKGIQKILILTYIMWPRRCVSVSPALVMASRRGKQARQAGRYMRENIRI